MKRIALLGLFALAFGSSAFATLEMNLQSGATNITIIDNGTGDANPATGDITYFNADLNGWNVEVETGISNSPNNTPGLDLTSLTATCELGSLLCTGATLQISISDTGFTGPVTLVNNYSGTIVDPSGNDGTAQFVYFSNTNTDFAKTTEVCENGAFMQSFNASCTGTVATGATYLRRLCRISQRSIATAARLGSLRLATMEISRRLPNLPRSCCSAQFCSA